MVHTVCVVVSLFGELVVECTHIYICIYINIIECAPTSSARPLQMPSRRRFMVFFSLPFGLMIKLFKHMKMRCSVSFKWFRIFVLGSPSKHLLQSSPINAQIAQWSSGFSMSFNIRPTNLILLTKSTSPLMLFDSFINSLEYNFSLSLLISFSLFSLLFFRVAVYSDVFCLISVSVINRPTNQPNILMQLEYHRD